MIDVILVLVCYFYSSQNHMRILYAYAEHEQT